MENIEKEKKLQIDNLQKQAQELKQRFLEISETVKNLNTNLSNIEIINNLDKEFSNFIFTIEEIGKKAGTLFANKNLYNDSSEVTKYLYQATLKLENLKESFLARDKTSFLKNLTALNRTVDGAEYMISLFYGELTAEITKMIFKPIIEKKSLDDISSKINTMEQSFEHLQNRIKKIESKISLMLRYKPDAFLDEDEAVVLKEIMRLHDENVMWVEPRFIEKMYPIPKRRLNEILEDLLHYGILEFKLRGGTKVYKYVQVKKNDINKN